MIVFAYLKDTRHRSLPYIRKSSYLNRLIDELSDLLDFPLYSPLGPTIFVIRLIGAFETVEFFLKAAAAAFSVDASLIAFAISATAADLSLMPLQHTE